MPGRKPGPAPKRATERVRRNANEDGIATVEISAEELEAQAAALGFEIETMVEPPLAPTGKADKWHPIAEMFYKALLRDPARMWMGPAAWVLAYIMCESLSRELKPQVVGIVEGGIDIETGEKLAGHVAREIVPLKGATIGAFLKWAATVGINEGDRLSMRKELVLNNVAPHAVEDVPDNVSQIRPDFFSEGQA